MGPTIGALGQSAQQLAEPVSVEMRMTLKEHFGQLTPEQDARWDAAMTEYDAVFRRNAEHARGAPISDDEWPAVRDADTFFSSYQPGHPKSSLFRRLLDGEAPLAHPPPCSYSYPWYDVIESSGPIHGFEVTFEGERGPALTLGEHFRANERGAGGIGMLVISQCVWTLLERSGDTAIVTFGEWAKLGYRWRLSRVTLPADQAPGYICCWHDESKSKITTVDELWAESEYHVMTEIRRMERVHAGLDPDPVEDGPALSGKRLHSLFAHGAKAAVQAKLDKRLARGYSAVPGKAWIRRAIRRRFNDYLCRKGAMRPDYTVGPDGLLLANVWRLERLV